LKSIIKKKQERKKKHSKQNPFACITKNEERVKLTDQEESKIRENQWWSLLE
jgi:hypothetical protein